MIKANWFRLAVVLGLGLGMTALILIMPKAGSARLGDESTGESERPPLTVMTSRDPLFLTSSDFGDSDEPPSMNVASVANSSVQTDDCYQAGKTATMCFTVYNGSTDGEWLDHVRVTFPQDATLGAWQVACHSQDATDSSGYPVNLTCSDSLSYQVDYTDNDKESPSIGEITTGSSWSFCTTVTVPSGYNGERPILWGISGDKDPGSAQPHDIEGTQYIEACTPLMIKPSSKNVEGCNGITQTHTFELWNNTGSSGTIDLDYDVTSGEATFTGPGSFSMSIGEIVTFTTQLVPGRFLSAGDMVTVTLNASGNGETDVSTLANTVTDLAGWQAQTTSITPTMDNVVVWASHEDGGLWSIGGYGSKGATQRYDPDTGTWTSYSSEISPTIQYPMDGCYGLNGSGEEIVVLFPDTILTDTLHVYNITQDAWSAEPVPTFFPVEGRWGFDIVSLRNKPGVNQNTCYLSGGAYQPGGGTTRDLWKYIPENNSGEYLGNFPADIWFDFHASWYVPWVGNNGAICVGGGIDHNSIVTSGTQCYDIEADTFNPVNADLGPLPEPWWGMADGWMNYEGMYQIWIANGVSQNGMLLPASAYADETTGGFVSGPELPVGLYRLEGAGWDGQFYTEQGSLGGFSYSYNNFLLAQCPACNLLNLPIILMDFMH